MQNKTRFSLIIWIVALIVIGGIIGSLTKTEINSWYITLHRSTMTPPNCVFLVAWTILYGMIGACGWHVYHYQNDIEGLMDFLKKYAVMNG